MTGVFDRGDCFYFDHAEQFRGHHFVVLQDHDQEVLFADTQGRLFEAEVGDETLYVSERGGTVGVSVPIVEITFE